MKHRLINLYLLFFNSIIFIPALAQTQLGLAISSSEIPAFRASTFESFISKGRIPIGENIYDNETISLPPTIPEYIQVITLNRDTVKKGCASGRLLKLKTDNFPHLSQFSEGAIEECGLGYAVASTVLAYSVIHKYGTPPSNWAAFFDIGRYPGKRALPIHVRGVLEAALMADGVPPKRVYDVLSTDQGVDRAFQKLDTILDSVIWWNSAKELNSWLISGEVALAIGLDGPILMGDGKHNISVIRNQSIYKTLYFSIPQHPTTEVEEGEYHVSLAYSFISYATQANQQKDFMHVMPYGSTLKQGWRELSTDDRRYSTNYPKNLTNAILEDYNFYMDHGKKIESRYDEWRKKSIPQVERIDVNSQL